MTDRTRITFLDIDAAGETEGESLVITDAGNIIASGVTGGSSLEVQKDDVQEVTNVTVLNFEGGAEVTDEGSGKATITISGGGAADCTIWMADAPPATAYVSGNTEDDEFDDASFDTGLWTEFDVAGTQTVGEDEYGVYMSTTSSNHLQGIFMDAPAGTDWSFTTYVGPMWDRDNSHRSGILLLEDTGNLSTSDCVLHSVYRGGAGFGWQIIYHTDYDSWSADDLNSVNDSRPAGMYLRFRRDGTNWYFDWSEDGKYWASNIYERAKRFTVDGIGVGHKFDNSGMTAKFPFARFKNDSDKDQRLYGDRVNLWRA